MIRKKAQPICVKWFYSISAMQAVKVPSEIVYTNISNFDEKQCFSVET